MMIVGGQAAAGVLPLLFLAFLSKACGEPVVTTSVDYGDPRIGYKLMFGGDDPIFEGVSCDVLVENHGFNSKANGIYSHMPRNASNDRPMYYSVTSGLYIFHVKEKTFTAWVIGPYAGVNKKVISFASGEQKDVVEAKNWKVAKQGKWEKDNDIKLSCDKIEIDYDGCAVLILEFTAKGY
eukprot:TRINITY_DN1336_c0_g1_i1.p1 TRINITY_DN1336_c0_g1~~TRINITY_DN1336_c0_g1_i1.p1  ORF type:complete len:180 (-),score=18.16 TRINITY_DN1336_c0_g1_i1:363-902(-)